MVAPSATCGPGEVKLPYGNPAPGGMSSRGTFHWFTGGSRRLSRDSNETGTLGGRLMLPADGPTIHVAPGN